MALARRRHRREPASPGDRPELAAVCSDREYQCSTTILAGRYGLWFCLCRMMSHVWTSPHLPAGLPRSQLDRVLPHEEVSA